MPFLNPYILLGVIFAWAASLGTVGYWQRGEGRQLEIVEWQQRENNALATANSTIQRLTKEARDRENTHQSNLAAISAQYQKDLKNAKAQRDRDIAAAYAGALKLRFFDPSPAGIKADRCAFSEVGASPGRRDGGAAGELPGAAVGAVQELPPGITAGLFALVHDADDTARQLAAAKQVILEDRRLCNGGG